MTVTKAVTDDRQKPTAEEMDAYMRREQELRSRFLSGTLGPKTVLAGIQTLMEMTGGCISCNAQSEIPAIQHVPFWVVDPTKLVTTSVFADGEDALKGKDYLDRAQKLSSGVMDDRAFDFYSKCENWKYLPDVVKVIVFPNTGFYHCTRLHCVRFLCRRNAEWRPDGCWIGKTFDRAYLVASLASPQVLDAQAS